MNELIDKAIEILERDGWCRGMFTDSEGRHCAIGALTAAQHEMGNIYPSEVSAVMLRMELVLEAELGQTTLLTQWNDKTAKDRDDVIRVLRLAEAQPLNKELTP